MHYKTMKQIMSLIIVTWFILKYAPKYEANMYIHRLIIPDLDKTHTAHAHTAHSTHTATPV